MFVNPKYRRNKSKFFHVDNITRIQYEKYKHELDVVFVSLKTNKNFRVLKQISQTIDSTLDWHFDECYYNTVPGQELKSCYQNITWASLKGNSINLKKLTEEQYETLPS